MSFSWRSRPLSCPECSFNISREEVQAVPFNCPSCETELTVRHKGNWLYAVTSFACAWLVAYEQRLESVMFAGGLLIYWAVAGVAIKALAWPLGLPVKLVRAGGYLQTLGIGSRKP